LKWYTQNRLLNNQYSSANLVVIPDNERSDKLRNLVGSTNSDRYSRARVECTARYFVSGTTGWCVLCVIIIAGGVVAVHCRQPSLTDNTIIYTALTRILIVTWCESARAQRPMRQPTLIQRFSSLIKCLSTPSPFKTLLSYYSYSYTTTPPGSRYSVTCWWGRQPPHLHSITKQFHSVFRFRARVITWIRRAWEHFHSGIYVGRLRGRLHSRNQPARAHKNILTHYE